MPKPPLPIIGKRYASTNDLPIEAIGTLVPASKIVYAKVGKYASEAKQYMTTLDWINVHAYTYLMCKAMDRVPVSTHAQIIRTVDVMMETHLATLIRGDSDTPTENATPMVIKKAISDLLSGMGISAKVIHLEEDVDEEYPLDNKHVLLPNLKTVYPLLVLAVLNKGVGFTIRVFNTRALAIEYAKSRAPDVSKLVCNDIVESKINITRIEYDGHLAAVISEASVHKDMPE